MSDDQRLLAIIIILLVAVLFTISFRILIYDKLKRSPRTRHSRSRIHSEMQFMTRAIQRFLDEAETGKPVKFSSLQIGFATKNFATMLGSGGFGKVYKGELGNGTLVAVKVLYDSPDEKIEAQFMSEVIQIGQIRHSNLVQLYGFCFEKNLKALVYEYLENGSLDRFLFQENNINILELEKLHEIGIGIAKGIAYLHEECQERIIHYNIKPRNIMLDKNFLPKVADFGLAKLCNKVDTHITMTGGNGIPGYTAPELRMSCPVTQKCDIYSFGMLLFELVGSRRNLGTNLTQDQEWFPKWVWKRMEDGGDLREVLASCAIEEKDSDVLERVLNTALLCVQYTAELRPVMTSVVKMLEGSQEIPTPVDPFPELLEEISCTDYYLLNGSLNSTSLPLSSSTSMTGSKITMDTPIMRKYEIEIATS